MYSAANGLRSAFPFIFLRKIVPGGTDKSYGIHVAQLAALPKSVLHRAEEILREKAQAAKSGR